MRGAEGCGFGRRGDSGSRPDAVRRAAGCARATIFSPFRAPFVSFAIHMPLTLALSQRERERSAAGCARFSRLSRPFVSFAIRTPSNARGLTAERAEGAAARR